MEFVTITESDEFLCGCDILHAEPLDSPLYDTAEEEYWRPLFPRGLEDASLAEEWAALEEFNWTPGNYQKFRAVVDGRDLGIADRLRDAGLKVVEIAGWQTWGRGSFFPRGSLDHHTAGPRSGNAPSLNICINGRSDLPGPLCHVLIGRDNTCYVIASGVANHAGSGGWRGLYGNSTVYGIERENVGTTAEPWRPDQTETAAKAHAALLRGRKIDSIMVCRHAEWTTRKPDTHSIHGPTLREMIAKSLVSAPPPAQYGILNSPIVGAALYGGNELSVPTGYVLVASDGGVFCFGSAKFHGSLGGVKLAEPIVGIALHPSGEGYWLVAADGGIFAFGKSGFFGSLPPAKLVKPIVGIASTSSGNGYWLVGADGGVFAYGDARFLGAVNQVPLAAPIVAIDATRSGNGYWLVASDGGVFAIGDAVYFGGATGSGKKIVSMCATPSEQGYWLASEDGSLYAYGDAPQWDKPPPMSHKTTHLLADFDGGAIVGEDGGVHGAGPNPIFFGSVYDFAK